MSSNSSESNFSLHFSTNSLSFSKSFSSGLPAATSVTIECWLTVAPVPTMVNPFSFNMSFNSMSASPIFMFQ